MSAAAAGPRGRPALLRGGAELRRVLRFGANGLFNTVFSYVSFVLLLALGLPSLAALILSSGFTVIISFFTSKRLVFRSRDRGRMPGFVLLYCVLLVLDAGALAGLEALRVPAWCAQALLALPIAVLGYLGQRTFVFGDPA